jgi:hypothetical protein
MSSSFRAAAHVACGRKVDLPDSTQQRSGTRHDISRIARDGRETEPDAAQTLVLWLIRREAQGSPLSSSRDLGLGKQPDDPHHTRVALIARQTAMARVKRLTRKAIAIVLVWLKIYLIRLQPHPAAELAAQRSKDPHGHNSLLARAASNITRLTLESTGTRYHSRAKRSKLSKLLVNLR